MPDKRAFPVLTLLAAKVHAAAAEWDEAFIDALERGMSTTWLIRHIRHRHQCSERHAYKILAAARTRTETTDDET